MTPQTLSRQRGNAAGKFITFILIIALLGLGGWLVMQDQGKPQTSDSSSSTTRRPPAGTPPRPSNP